MAYDWPAFGIQLLAEKQKRVLAKKRNKGIIRVVYVTASTNYP
jgi:hypothetical protein